MDRQDLPPGVASSHLHKQVYEGDLLQVRPPSGRFFIDGEAEVPVVFIAGSIGITPMISMLAWCLEHQPGRILHRRYYGLRHGGEHAFKAGLEELTETYRRFHLNSVCSQPRSGDVQWGDVQGRDYQRTAYVDLALLRRTLPHGRHVVY